MEAARTRSLLTDLYGTETGESAFRALNALLDKYRGRIPRPRREGLSEQDAVLITYADQVQEAGRASLASLREFCDKHIRGLVSGIHILPFYPWSSDDGFSVVDYRAVAPQYGEWSDLRMLGERFRLMFDAVVNHMSAESPWFQRFLRDEAAYRDFFIEVHGSPDLSQVVRPRTLPLLTQFSGPKGTREVWTTFSADQIDLNYHSPGVLLQILDVLLFYARQRAEFVRLDAIAYLWKEVGTPCINLPQTHWIVQLMRAALNAVAPHVMLITETNVPNLENLSYFGDGSNEAQLVYNFPLPPLVLHALLTGNARALSDWAATLRLPSPHVTFLNFLASHDGIGLNPVRGILPESEVEALARRIQAGGGFVSYKSNPDGSLSPYELNVNYFDALVGAPSVEPATGIGRFLTAHAILLAFVGMPAIYFHSLFGSRGWPEGVKQTGKNRAINREKLQRSDLERELADDHSLRAQIFDRLSRLLRVRAGCACFSPEASQRVLTSSRGVFVILREAPRTGMAALCIHNVNREQERVELDLSGTSLVSSEELRDAISGKIFPGGKHLTVVLAPYESVWLTN